MSLKKGYLALSFALLSFSASTLAADSLCQQKERDIQHEIALAKQHDNQRRVNGLERALTEVRASCTDGKLQAAHQERIKAQQQKVAEREHELKEERQEGDDREKVAKRERKLEEARQALKKLQAEPY
ncbi:DUF1090 domain-containing protein [Pantoea sp.]|uniref:DUF1090 domain-containing protein n=1 Tax=Pantoea sp. TaxID=69393 RepID=UPI002896CA9F|nr:DUF1090 domain-containing protein [Pantoea sp.]